MADADSEVSLYVAIEKGWKAVKFVQLVSIHHDDRPNELFALADDGSVWVWLSRGEEPGWHDFETCKKPFPKTERPASETEKAARKGVAEELAGRFLNEPGFNCTRFNLHQIAEFAINWMQGPLKP